jgi:hypothetical protein
VGLELLYINAGASAPAVSIPHGGLRTYLIASFKRMVEVEVSIPHGGLRTLGEVLQKAVEVIVSIPHGGLRTLSRIQRSFGR